MSHDQKPGKMRVVGSSAAGRRRGDLDTTPALSLPNSATPDTNKSHPGASSRKFTIVLSILFVLGCAMGGAALPLLDVL